MADSDSDPMPARGSRRRKPPAYSAQGTSLGGGEESGSSEADAVAGGEDEDEEAEEDEAIALSEDDEESAPSSEEESSEEVDEEEEHAAAARRRRAAAKAKAKAKAKTAGAARRAAAVAGVSSADKRRALAKFQKARSQKRQAKFQQDDEEDGSGDDGGSSSADSEGRAQAGRAGAAKRSGGAGAEAASSSDDGSEADSSEDEDAEWQPEVGAVLAAHSFTPTEWQLCQIRIDTRFVACGSALWPFVLNPGWKPKRPLGAKAKAAAEKPKGSDGEGSGSGSESEDSGRYMEAPELSEIHAKLKSVGVDVELLPRGADGAICNVLALHVPRSAEGSDSPVRSSFSKSPSRARPASAVKAIPAKPERSGSHMPRPVAAAVHRAQELVAAELESGKRREQRFLVRWKGLYHRHCSWETRASLECMWEDSVQSETMARSLVSRHRKGIDKAVAAEAARDAARNKAGKARLLASSAEAAPAMRSPSVSGASLERLLRGRGGDVASFLDDSNWLVAARVIARRVAPGQSEEDEEDDDKATEDSATSANAAAVPELANESHPFAKYEYLTLWAATGAEYSDATWEVREDLRCDACIVDFMVRQVPWHLRDSLLPRRPELPLKPERPSAAAQAVLDGEDVAKVVASSAESSDDEEAVATRVAAAKREAVAWKDIWVSAKGRSSSKPRSGTGVFDLCADEEPAKPVRRVGHAPVRPRFDAVHAVLASTPPIVRRAAARDGIPDASMRTYQVEGLTWLLFNYAFGQNCLLADEMGLGKTIQTVALMAMLHQRLGVQGPFLVVAPKSTLGHWAREVKRWSGLNAVVYSGSQDSRAKIREHEFQLAPHDVDWAEGLEGAGYGTLGPDQPQEWPIRGSKCLSRRRAEQSKEDEEANEEESDKEEEKSEKEGGATPEAASEAGSGSDSPILGPSGRPIRRAGRLPATAGGLASFAYKGAGASSGAAAKGGSAAPPAPASETAWRSSKAMKSAWERGNPYKFDVLITTADTVRNDAAEFCISWALVVVDEAQMLKDAGSVNHSVLSTVSEGAAKLLLTGTPIQNRVDEVWSLLHFLSPEEFPSREDFEAEAAESLDGVVGTLKQYMLRRRKTDVAKELPPRKELIMRVPLTSLQRRVYEEIYSRSADQLKAADGKAARGFVKSLNNLQMQLRKCCNHAFSFEEVEDYVRDAGTEDPIVRRFDKTAESIVGEEAWTVASTRTRAAARVDVGLLQGSGKFMFLDKLLPYCAEHGHRVLLFSQFKLALNLLEDFLALRGWGYERIDGDVSGAERQAAIDRFNDPGSSSLVFLLSTRASGTGINLTSADTVVIFDSDWNPQNDAQAMARSHRIGQTKEVRVYRLVTQDTYESAMVAIASKKLGLERAMLMNVERQASEDGGSAGSVKLSKEDMDKLIKEGYYGVVKRRKQAGEGQGEGAGEDGEEAHDDDVEEEAAFNAANIDDLLSHSSTAVAFGSGVDDGHNAFAEATFAVHEASSANEKDFWAKAAQLKPKGPSMMDGSSRRAALAQIRGANRGGDGDWSDAEPEDLASAGDAGGAASHDDDGDSLADDNPLEIAAIHPLSKAACSAVVATIRRFGFLDMPAPPSVVPASVASDSAADAGVTSTAASGAAAAGSAGGAAAAAGGSSSSRASSAAVAGFWRRFADDAHISRPEPGRLVGRKRSYAESVVADAAAAILVASGFLRHLYDSATEASPDAPTPEDLMRWAKDPVDAETMVNSLALRWLALPEQQSGPAAELIRHLRRRQGETPHGAPNSPPASSTTAPAASTQLWGTACDAAASASAALGSAALVGHAEAQALPLRLNLVAEWLCQELAKFGEAMRVRLDADGRKPRRPVAAMDNADTVHDLRVLAASVLAPETRADAVMHSLLPRLSAGRGWTSGFMPLSGPFPEGVPAATCLPLAAKMPDQKLSNGRVAALSPALDAAAAAAAPKPKAKKIKDAKATGADTPTASEPSSSSSSSSSSSAASAAEPAAAAPADVKPAVKPPVQGPVWTEAHDWAAVWSAVVFGIGDVTLVPSAHTGGDDAPVGFDRAAIQRRVKRLAELTKMALAQHSRLEAKRAARAKAAAASAATAKPVAAAGPPNVLKQLAAAAAAGTSSSSSAEAAKGSATPAASRATKRPRDAAPKEAATGPLKGVTADTLTAMFGAVVSTGLPLTQGAQAWATARLEEVDGSKAAAAMNAGTWAPPFAKSEPLHLSAAARCPATFSVAGLASAVLRELSWMHASGGASPAKPRSPTSAAKPGVAKAKPVSAAAITAAMPSLPGVAMLAESLLSFVGPSETDRPTGDKWRIGKVSIAIPKSRRAKLRRRIGSMWKLRTLLFASTAGELDAAIAAAQPSTPAAGSTAVASIFAGASLPKWWTPQWDRWLLLGSATCGLTLWLERTVGQPDGCVFAASADAPSAAAAPPPGSLAAEVPAESLGEVAANRRLLQARVDAVLAKWPARASAGFVGAAQLSVPAKAPAAKRPKATE